MGLSNHLTTITTISLVNLFNYQWKWKHEERGMPPYEVLCLFLLKTFSFGGLNEAVGQTFVTNNK